MARVHSPLQIQGAIGTIVIAGTQGGGQRAYLKPHFNKEKWKTHHRLHNSRASAVSFGGAAMCGSAIYKRVCYGMEGQVMPYAHNEIARRLRSHAEASIFTTRYAFDTAQDALRNLDLSPAEGRVVGKQVRILPLGPVHAPTSFRIQGLREAAEQIMRDTRELQCRLVCRSMAFPGVQYDGKEWRHTTRPVSATAWESLWIPMDLVPAEGLLAPIPQQTDCDDAPQLHFAMVEWRRVEPRRVNPKLAKYRSADRKPRLLKDKTICRLAAFTVPGVEESALDRCLAVPARRRFVLVRRRWDGRDGAGDTPACLLRPHLLETPLYLRLAMRGQWRT